MVLNVLCFSFRTSRRIQGLERVFLLRRAPIAFMTFENIAYDHVLFTKTIWHFGVPNIPLVDLKPVNTARTRENRTDSATSCGPPVY